MRLPRTAVAVVVSFLTCAAPGSGLKKQPIVVVNGPTVIAFFEPVSDTDLKKRPEWNESLSDFQISAKSLRGSFAERKIRFYELYASSFRVEVGTRISTVRVNQGAGYYLVTPGQEPRVINGVMTDSDLLHEAVAYFPVASTR